MDEKQNDKLDNYIDKIDELFESIDKLNSMIEKIDKKIEETRFDKELYKQDDKSNKK